MDNFEGQWDLDCCILYVWYVSKLYIFSLVLFNESIICDSRLSSMQTMQVRKLCKYANYYNR